MSDNEEDEKVIDLGKSFGGLSPSDILANPRKFLHGQAPPEAKGQGRPATPPEATPKADDDNPGGGPESFDDESADYKAFGWAGNKTLPILRLIYKDGSEGLIVYGHIDTNLTNGSQFLPRPPGRKGNLIFLRVVGHDGVFMLVIEGLRLRRIWELILAHKTPWIHELPEGLDFGGNGEPVIWSFTAKGPLKAERRAAAAETA